MVQFTVINPDFPRSLTYCLDGIERALERIGGVPNGTLAGAMDALRTHLRDTTPKAILDQGLHEYLEQFLVLLEELTNALQGDYFEAHLGDAE